MNVQLTTRQSPSIEIERRNARLNLYVALDFLDACEQADETEGDPDYDRAVFLVSRAAAECDRIDREFPVTAA